MSGQGAITTVKTLALKESAIDAEVDLAQGTWVLAVHLRRGDLVRLGGERPFIVADWISDSRGVWVYDLAGVAHLCPGNFPRVLMEQADFLRRNFPAGDFTP